MNKSKLNFWKYGIGVKILCLAFLIGLTSCNAMEGAAGPFSMGGDGGARRFYITAADDANSHAPVAVDIAFTSNPELARHLSTLPAREFFKQRTQLLRDYPHQLLIASWEVIPGHTIDETVRDYQDQHAGAFLFADYSVPGQHRAAIPVSDTLVVHLGRHDFTVTPLHNMV